MLCLQNHLPVEPSFQDLQFNTFPLCYLARHLIKVKLQTFEALWIEIVQKKYLRHTDFFSAIARPQYSFTWRCILKSRSVLENGLAINIGNGQSTKFLLDNWCLSSPIIQDSLVELSEDDADSSVADYCDSSGSWAIHKLRSYLPDEIVFSIASMWVLSDSEVLRAYFWKLESDGLFSVASA